MFNLGFDTNGTYVRYADDVAENERVEGLCEYLEKEYEQIVAFAAELMGTRIEKPVRIPVVLSKEQITVKYPNNDKKLAAMIKHHADVKGKQMTEAEILDILHRKKDEQTAVGWYYHTGAPFETPSPFAFADGAKPYVVLFYTAVDAENFDDYCAELTRSLAHEYFHTLHNGVTMASFYKKTPYGKGLKESLSDFFSVLYLLSSHEDGDLKLKRAEQRYDTWDDYFGSSWAYAHALWYYRIGATWQTYTDSYEKTVQIGAVDKFLAVFEQSKTSMKKAYGKLVNHE